MRCRAFWLILILSVLLTGPVPAQMIVSPPNILDTLTITTGPISMPSGGCINWNTGDVTLCHGADTLTLAGGVLVLPSGTAANPALQIGSGFANLYDNSGLIIGLGASNSLLWVKTAQIEIAQATSLGWGLTGAFDLQLAREAAYVLQQGADAPVPLAQTFKAPDGSGTDINGAKFTFGGGRGTGTGTGGPACFSTSPAGTTGSSQNALVERVCIDSTGGLRWLTTAEPTCNSTTRGTVNYVAGGAGVLDTFKLCRKDAADAYAWVTLF